MCIQTHVCFLFFRIFLLTNISLLNLQTFVLFLQQFHPVPSLGEKTNSILEWSGGSLSPKDFRTSLSHQLMAKSRMISACHFARLRTAKITLLLSASLIPLLSDWEL